MQNHNSLKKEIMKKLLHGLQICNSSKANMSLLERKKAIKLSADLAMASTKKAKKHHWSHALINKASKDSETSTLAKQILQANNTKDEHFFFNATKTKHKKTTIRARNRGTSKFTSPNSSWKVYQSRKNGPRKSNGATNSYIKVFKARSMAKRLVKMRTQILKGLVPGGEYLDQHSLLKETLDYIVSLRAQVEIMHHLAKTPQLIHYYNS